MLSIKPIIRLHPLTIVTGASIFMGYLTPANNPTKRLIKKVLCSYNISYSIAGFVTKTEIYFSFPGLSINFTKF